MTAAATPTHSSIHEILNDDQCRSREQLVKRIDNACIDVVLHLHKHGSNEGQSFLAGYGSVGHDENGVRRDHAEDIYRNTTIVDDAMDQGADALCHGVFVGELNSRIQRVRNARQKLADFDAQARHEAEVEREKAEAREREAEQRRRQHKADLESFYQTVDNDPLVTRAADLAEAFEQMVSYAREAHRLDLLQKRGELSGSPADSMRDGDYKRFYESLSRMRRKDSDFQHALDLLAGGLGDRELK